MVINLKEMQNKLKDALPQEKFNHSINVMNTAVELAEFYGIDKDKAALAGLLHDCAKQIKGEKALEICKKFDIEVDDIMGTQTGLLHGPIGACIAEFEYGIGDASILKAIFHHTMGCENMDTLSKIIYIADYIEPERDFSGVEEIREKAKKDLDQAIIMAIDTTLKHVIAKGDLIHIDTVNARNYLIKNKIKN